MPRSFAAPTTLARRSALASVLSLIAAIPACSDQPTQPIHAPARAASLTTGTNGAALSVTPGSYDYGELAALDTTVATVFTIANTGTGDMIFNAYSLTGDNWYDFSFDFTAKPRCSDGLGVAPGASCLIGVKYTPLYIRSSTAALAISTTAGDTIITLTGNAIAAAAATPETLSFGGQIVGTQSAPQTIKIKNKSSQPIVVLEYVFDNPDDFVVAGTSSNACQVDAPLAGGATCDVTVAFAPSATGSRSASLRIQTNTGATTVALSGTGLPPAADISVAMMGTLQGKSIVYQLTVKNAGPSAAANVTVNDAIPAGTTFAGVTAPGDVTCTSPNVGANGPVKCTFSSLASGATRTLQLTVKVSGGTKGALVNTATATAASPADPATGNNTATVTTVVSKR